MFGGVPEATYDDAIASLLEAENLSLKPWKENKLLVAKSYIKKKDYLQALQWLDRAAELPDVTPEVSC